MKRFVLVAGFTVLLGWSAVWTGVAQQQPKGANAARFTGTSTPMDGKDLTIARRRFEAGARTYWHSHDRGQLLLVEQGRMRTQKRNERMRELGVGESDYTAANVAHWHGAGADQPLVQVNAGFGGGPATWFEEVSADDYAGRTR
jgi:quercetin dioxygenase-like cupin family protein